MEFNRRFIFIALIAGLFFAYYLHKSKIIEYEDLKSVILNSATSNCANKEIEYEYRNKLTEINTLLSDLNNNYEKILQKDDMGVSKLSETLKILESLLKTANIPNNQEINHDDEEADIKYHMKVYDLNTPNENKFECVKSRPIIVQTTICIHDIGRDIYVSGAIKGSGVWEDSLVQLFMRMLNSNKDINVIDIGAQLGQYSLYAAKLGRKCVSVEPFYDSYIRLHKSILIENLKDKFTLIINGVSDKRGEFKKLQAVSANVGGQGLLADKNDYSSKMNETHIKNDKYIIETILMDDIVQILPKDFNKVIMKIDIEGYEVKAFRKASKLFSKLDILVVLMEWMGKTDTNYFNENDINELLDFFYNRNYEVRNPNNLNVLNRSDWKIWPGDIIIIKKDFTF